MREFQFFLVHPVYTMLELFNSNVFKIAFYPNQLKLLIAFYPNQLKLLLLLWLVYMSQSIFSSKYNPIIDL